ALRSVLAACGFAKAKHQFPPEICRPLVTMILTEPLDGTSIDVLRARSQRPKLRGAKVTQRQGGHGPRAGARRGRARLAGQCGLIRAHEFGAIGQALQRHGVEARSPEVETRLPVSINEAVHEFRQTAHHTRSHSFASVVSPDRSVGSAVMITIFPVLSISIRAICTPAALTALTALVTSCCRNVDGARAMASVPPMPESPERPERGYSS